MVISSRISRFIIFLSVLIGSISAPAKANEPCAFSASGYAISIRSAVLSEDYALLGVLAGGEQGPGAPHTDFIMGGENASEGAVPMKEFLSGAVYFLLAEDITSKGHYVQIAFVSSESKNPSASFGMPDLSTLRPYIDFYLCEAEIVDGRPVMRDFCFSESDALFE